MEIHQHFVQMLAVYMHVHFRSGNALVPQHLLDGPEVGTIFQEMGGKGVPKSMRTDVLLQSNGFGQALYNGKDHGTGQLFAPTI